MVGVGAELLNVPLHHYSDENEQQSCFAYWESGVLYTKDLVFQYMSWLAIQN
ncbi:hypothetical protein [Nostoc sp. CMAA1605]|uniref:hypothetical protein n=1 Tax=Nostoc sp. CMAA1605 TaxID=2055159 RepID=UPI001F258129|nr:hypothetical protein [Nostoc sp. CMAA1605]